MLKLKELLNEQDNTTSEKEFRKIEKINRNEFVSFIDETYVGGITIRGRGEVQKIEPPRNQFSFGPFIGVAYNNATGLTEPIVGIGVSYNLIKVWDWR